MHGSAQDIVAVCAFIATIAAAVAVAVRLFRRSPYRPLQTAFYYLMVLLVRVLWRARIEGRIDLPPGRGAVIVCNHRSSIDPCFIQIDCDRVVHWMVAKEYFAHPATAWFLRLAETIPTSRAGTDTAATRTAIRRVAAGGFLGVFPEGRINRTAATLLPGRPGAVMIALKARATIVPCHLSGSPYDGTPYGAVLMPAKTRLRIGTPLDLSPYFDRADDRDLLAELTRQVLKEIARLGGDEEFAPQLAGRNYKPEA